MREGYDRLPGDITSRVSGFPALSPYAIATAQRSLLWAKATKSITLVTLARTCLPGCATPTPRSVRWRRLSAPWACPSSFAVPLVVNVAVEGRSASV